MIQLFMKRSGSPVIVPLNLPASHDAMTEAASQLDEASRAGKTEIVEIKSVITNLPSYLGGLDPDSRTQLAQLNQLSSIIAKMDSRERDIYAGALDGNSINDLNDMIRVAEQVSDYILIPNVNSDVTLGRYVAVAGQIQGDPRFPEAAWPYLDFAKIGAEYYAEHGGAYTYAACTKQQAEELIRGLREIAPYVVIDCSSYIANDILSAVALMEADSVLRLANCDLKSIGYLSSQLPLLRELHWDEDKQYKAASNIKPLQAADRIGQVLGSVAFQLPHSRELEEQYLEGTLLNDLSMKDSKAFRREIEKICKEVF